LDQSITDYTSSSVTYFSPNPVAASRAALHFYLHAEPWDASTAGTKQFPEKDLTQTTIGQLSRQQSGICNNCGAFFPFIRRP
jgi:hypothetical protein